MGSKDNGSFLYLRRGLNKNTLIYVAGHTGLAGSALVRRLTDKGYTNLLLKPHSELDLRNSVDVEYFFTKRKPRVVILAAAHAGGIHEAIDNPAWMLLDNLEITSNIIRASFLVNVEKLIFLSSSCVYPVDGSQPYSEEQYGHGRTDENWSYAIAKIAGTELCRSFHRQYDCNFMTVVPCNLFGPNDNFDPKKSHVIPGIIRKFHESNEVSLWGDGAARREFLHSDDFADACLTVMEKCDYKDINGIINIGTGWDISIRNLAHLIAHVVRPGDDVRISFDQREPNGVPSKLLNIDKIKQLGWKPKYSLEEGIKLTYDYFCSHRKPS